MKKNICYIFLLLFLISCTEENLPSNVSNYSISLKKDYSYNNNNFLVTDSAKITLKIGEKIYQQYTDSLLTANFISINSGTALVTINYPNFSEVKYKVYIPDGSNLNSQIKLLPKNGNYAAILKGNLQTSAGTIIKQPLTVMVSSADSIEKFVSGANIYDIYIENFSRNNTETSNGAYSFTLPATLQGVKYIINADGFLSGNTAYEVSADTITLFSGKTSVKNLIYR